MTKEQSTCHEVCRHHEGVSIRIGSNEKAIAELDAALVRIHNRPPVWATAVISILMGLLGVATACAAIAVKNGGP